MQGKFRLGLLAGTSMLIGAVTFQAAAQELDIGEIVVTPSRIPQERANVGSTVEKVDRRQIEAESKPTVTDYLANQPGIAISQTGGAGSEGTLAIRGAPRRYVKTLFNGIDIGDPTQPNVQTSYQYLLADNLDSIEVLKGSQSTLYGSDAIAGVIGLSTLGEIPEGVRHLFHLEGGSRTSIRGGYGLRASDGGSKVSINATGFYTDGISAADENDGNTERDGFANGSFDAAGEVALSDVLSVFGTVLYINSRAEFDDSFPIQDNPDAVNFSRQLAGRMGFNLDLADGRFRNTFAVQGYGIDRSIRGTAFANGDYEGNRWKAEYQGAFDANDWLTLLMGADYEGTSINVPDGANRLRSSFNLGGLWFDAVVSPVEELTFTVGARQSWHSAFGGNTTWRATGSYDVFATGTRFHSSIGTGFRAPSLDELYGPFGSNPNLQPERSLSFDAGIEQRLGSRLVADLTYFHINIDDLIGYSGGYVQIPGTARKRGVEASMRYAATDWLDIGGFYTYTSAVSQTGARLPRIPAHVVGLNVSAQPWEKWTISADARLSVDAFDGGRLKDYLLVNAKIGYQATENSEFYVRAENVLNQQYQTARGYGTPNFSVFAGYRGKFGQ